MGVLPVIGPPHAVVGSEINGPDVASHGHGFMTLPSDPPSPINAAIVEDEGSPLPAYRSPLAFAACNVRLGKLAWIAAAHHGSLLPPLILLLVVDCRSPMPSICSCLAVDLVGIRLLLAFGRAGLLGLEVVVGGLKATPLLALRWQGCRRRELGCVGSEEAGHRRRFDRH
ncbi:hypothetical protein ACLOJK_032092 [Asimina triloba]